MTTTTETVDFQVQVSDGTPPTVTVTSTTRGTLYTGPLPPFGAVLPSNTLRLPGVDFDLTLRLAHAQLADITFPMHIRDGIEVDTPTTPAVHAQLAMPYSAALRMLYAGEPFAEHLDVATAASHYELLSCLSGIVYAPGAARLHTSDPTVLDALCRWGKQPQESTTPKGKT